MNVLLLLVVAYRKYTDSRNVTEIILKFSAHHGMLRGCVIGQKHGEFDNDTIRWESLMWTRKLSIQLNLAHVARN